MGIEDTKKILKNLNLLLETETPEDPSMEKMLNQKLLEIELRPERNVQLNPLLSENEDDVPFWPISTKRTKTNLKQNVKNCLKALPSLCACSSNNAAQKGN